MLSNRSEKWEREWMKRRSRISRMSISTRCSVRWPRYYFLIDEYHKNMIIFPKKLDFFASPLHQFAQEILFWKKGIRKINKLNKKYKKSIFFDYFLWRESVFKDKNFLITSRSRRSRCCIPLLCEESNVRVRTGRRRACNAINFHYLFFIQHNRSNQTL